MRRVQYITSTKSSKRKLGKVTVILLYHSFVPKMKSFGNIAMIPISKNYRLIDRHIASIKSAIRDFDLIISSGYDSKKVQKYVYQKYGDLDVRCVENIIYEDSNICESIRIAINNTKNENILIVNGNFLFESQDLEDMIKNGYGTIVSTSKQNKTLDIGVNVNDQDSGLEHISYGSSGNGWCEILYVNKKTIVNEMKKILEGDTFRTKIFYELINNMIKKNIRINCHKTSSKIVKISNLNHRKEEI